MNKTIGIIGFGNMGQAIAQQLGPGYGISVFDKDRNKTRGLGGMSVAQDLQALLTSSDALILAVKPQDFDSVIKEIKGFVKGQLVISIAAGITTAHIETILQKARVVRVMPNLPAKVAQGMIVLCKGEYAKDLDLTFAQELFSKLGRTMIIEEDKMDAATAVSGSGPGFFFSLIQPLPQSKWEEFGNNTFTPALIKAAEQVGFPAQEAKVLASTTTNGSITLLTATGSNPESLCIQVASKGGTTEAGLKVLRQDIENLSEAVQAAKKRAEELSKKE